MHVASCYRGNHCHTPQKFELIRPTLLYSARNWIVIQITEKNCIGYVFKNIYGVTLEGVRRIKHNRGIKSLGNWIYGRYPKCKFPY